MNENNRAYPNLVAKIQVYMSNKTQNSNDFSLLRKSGSYKNMLNFMAIVYVLGAQKNCLIETVLLRTNNIFFFFFINKKADLKLPLI